MKNYQEKEQKLENALERLKSISDFYTSSNKDFSTLESQKNQLLREKMELEENYKNLFNEYNRLKMQLNKKNKEIDDQFSKQNKFNKTIDELNQETENLIEEIDKWQT